MRRAPETRLHRVCNRAPSHYPNRMRVFRSDCAHPTVPPEGSPHARTRTRTRTRCRKDLYAMLRSALEKAMFWRIGADAAVKSVTPPLLPDHRNSVQARPVSDPVHRIRPALTPRAAARNGLRDVIMAAGRVVNQIAPTSSGAPFQSDQLHRDPRAHRAARPCPSSAAESRSRYKSDFALGGVVFHAGLPELLPGLLAGIAVARDRGHAAALDQRRKVADDGFRREWRSDLAHGIENASAVLLMRARQGRKSLLFGRKKRRLTGGRRVRPLTRHGGQAVRCIRL